MPKPSATGTAPRSIAAAHEDPLAVRITLTVLAILIMGVLIVVPLVNVFYQAFAAGVGTYFDNLFNDPDTRHSVYLTLIVAPTAVLANIIFGVAAAWAIARFRLQGFLGPWLRAHDIKVIFAIPGLIIATAFVTFPVVARELIPLMEAIGADEEIAAVSLGARGWQMFRRVTLPNIKWGLLYGIILCNARAMGEFGAVSVVSGHVRGLTNTMPLRVEKLFQEYNMPGAFAVASVLASLALVTLLVKTVLEWKTRSDLAAAAREATEGGHA